MALTPLQLQNAELTTSFVTQYTVPALTKCRLTEILMCNTSGATRTVTICIVESGDTADETTPNVNAIAKGFDLPQGVPVALTFNTWLDAGDFISAKASDTGVTFIASGIEET